jgi:hypothetical protein
LPVARTRYFLMMTFLSSKWIVCSIFHHFTIFMIKNYNSLKVMNSSLRKSYYSKLEF